MATAVKEAPFTEAIPGSINMAVVSGRTVRNEVRLMSDRVTLIRRSTSENGRTVYASGWTVRGHLKDGVTTEQWCESYRTKGWTVTRATA